MTNRTNRNNDIDALRETISLIDCIAQKGLSEISAIAELALTALETTKPYRNPEIIAQALITILNKSDDIDNCINCEAEAVGLNYKDPKAETPVRR